MEFVELTNVGDQYPDELSGGMKSRVALARALAYGGDLFLLDEPFAALNEDLRRPLAEKLRNHLKKIGASAILITHQSADAEIFADRILTFASINQ
jgi:ABC-type nitrate/sulfonate/bicarbonate transport system ATPase subunit